jgi:outer membrane porin, OprD family
LKIWFFIALFIASTMLHGQHQELQEAPKIWNGENKEKADSLSLLTAFRNGKVNGHFRYFYSSTDNSGDLTDYFAHAAGGGLRYETAPFYGLQMAVSGYYIFDIGSSDFTIKDKATGQVNRYEIGLYDINNPAEKNEISRLEELYLKYQYKNNFIRIGKQLINTPFVNLQDGRMRPTQVQGLWIDAKPIKNLTLQGGWLNKISPRSTSEWFSVASSVGVYPSGVNPDGTKSNYRNNISSKGVALIGLEYKLQKNMNLRAWNLYTENIFNSLLLQADGNVPLNSNIKMIYGVQMIHQVKINDGGNPDQNKSYFNNEKNALTYGARLGAKYKNIESTLNYNRITAAGRYLMPREWGRDPFFTFMPRERNEGFADVHAIMLQTKYAKAKSPFTVSIAGGYFQLPDVKDTASNKYGMPSYSQMNIDLRYKLRGWLQGMEAQVLLVRKWEIGETYDSPNFVFNKVDMNLINVVINYNFSN